MSDEDYDKPISQLPDAEKLAVFKDWLKLSREAFAKQRERARKALLFQFPENQWPDEAKTQRKGKPMLAISLIQGPLQYVYNQAAAAHFGVDLKPLNEKSLTKLAEFKKGLYERGQRDGEANPARLWAFDHASQTGLGWYRLNTKWDEDSDNPSDQEICYERILYQEMVFADPAAQKPDFSDGRFLGLGAYVPCREAKRRYKGMKVAESAVFAELQSTEPDWVRANGKDHEPLLVELFYKETTYEEVTVEGTDYSRLRERAEVRRAVLTAVEVLEDQPWLADKEGRGRQYIPFVPTIGVERQAVDGERLWDGMTAGAMDGQIVFNYAISKSVEVASTSNRAQYLVLEGQIEGYEKQWDEMHLTNRAYLPYRNVTLDGKPAGPPQLVQVDSTKMGLALELSQQARELVQTATQGYEPMEQPRNKAEQSGRAILALENKADAGRSHYIQNLKDISLPLDARIWLDMAPVVYDRPGRVLHILGIEEETNPVMIGKHFVVRNGMPVPVSPETPDAEYIDLSQGKYAIVPVMGKAPQTRLQEGQDFMSEVIKADPTQLSKWGDLLFQWRDEPGAKQIAERMKRVIQMTMPGLIEDKGGQQDAQAQLQATKQQLQMVMQQAQQMADALKTEQAKQQANVAIAKFKSEADIKIAEMDNATKIAVARITAAKESMNQAAEAQEELVGTGIKVQAEAEQNELDRQHETDLAHKKMAHEVAMAAAGGNTMKRTVDRGQEQDQEQSQEQSQGGSESQENSNETGPAPQADGGGD